MEFYEYKVYITLCGVASHFMSHLASKVYFWNGMKLIFTPAKWYVTLNGWHLTLGENILLRNCPKWIFMHASGMSPYVGWHPTLHEKIFLLGNGLKWIFMHKKWYVTLCRVAFHITCHLVWKVISLGNCLKWIFYACQSSMSSYVGLCLTFMCAFANVMGIHSYYAGTNLSCAGIQQMEVSFCFTATNLVGEMSNEDPPPLPISSWEWKWHEQWGGSQTPNWSSAAESWSDMSNEDPNPPLVISIWELKWHEQWGGPQPIPHWSSGVEHWSDLSNEDPHPSTQLIIRSSELKWYGQWGVLAYWDHGGSASFIVKF